MLKPVNITLQNFYKELSVLPVDWLLANVGDKIRVETTFSVRAFCIGSTAEGNIFTLNATDGYVGAGWVVGFDDCFKNFKIGDSINFYNAGASTTFTIIDKLSDYEIRLNTAFTATADNFLMSSCIFSLLTPITAIKYHYNFIENGSADSFASIIDGSEQLLVSEYKLASDVTATAMQFNGSLCWQSGSATIQGVSAGVVDGVYTSIYKIIHYTKVTPFLLYNQLDDQLAGIPYKDFKVAKCWKFITFIEAAEVFTNPNFLVSEVFSSVLGNSGWYNENYNTGKTNYSISNVAYNNNGAIDSISFDATETTITFNINNVTDTPFHATLTKFVLGFFKIPSDPIEYQNNNTLLDRNFLFDRALQTIAAAPVNGDNYGGNYQVLKSISAAFVSTSVITVTVKIAMSSTVLASFQESELPQYFLYCQVQNHTKATADPYNDLVTLEVDINEFTVVSSDPNMIIPSNVFIRHPEVDPVNEGVQLGFGNNSISTETVNAGSQPVFMAHNTTNKRIYITNAGDNSITVIATIDNSVITTISTPAINNYQIAFDSFQNRMYVSDVVNDNITIIDCVTNTVLGQINVPTGVGDLAYCPINKCIYVCNTGTVVRVINTLTDTVTASITVGTDPTGIAYNDFLNKMYVTNVASDNISIIDCATNTVTGTIATDQSAPTYIVYNSVQKQMYYLTIGASQLEVLDCLTNDVTPIVSSLVSGALEYNPADNQIYCSNDTGQMLVVFDCVNNSVRYSITLTTTISDVLYDTLYNKLFVLNITDDYVWVMTSAFDVFPEDEIVACSDFYIESEGRETDVIKLTSVNAKIIVKNIITGDEFEIDQFLMNLASIPLTGYTQQFDAQVARAFHIPLGTIRKYIEVKRRNDLDTGTRKYFSSYYPFLFRWETWTAQLGVDPFFFDSSLPNNGFNEWWFHYVSGKWKINYKLVINATKNGTPQQYELLNEITPHDYNSNAEWTGKTITTFDPDTLVSLTTGGNTFISGYKDTLIVAEFTRVTPPSGYTVVIGIEAYMSGGVYGKRRYSSKWVADSDTWFKSIDGSGKVIVTNVGNVVTAKCLIDYTLLPQGIASYKITARIYEPNVGNALTTDDGIDITTDDGVVITID